MLKHRHLVIVAMVLIVGRSAEAGPLREVSREAGLDGVVTTGAMRVDFDGDGALDLLLSTPEGLALYRNHRGRFEEAGVSFGQREEEAGAAAWGDFDRDGDPDLFFTGRYGANRLYRNEGGAFKDVAGAVGLAKGGGVAAAWGDFDGDGDPDLVVGRVGALLLYRNEGATFVEVAGQVGLSGAMLISDVSWVDFDGDGDLDLFCAGPRSFNRLYRNEGSRFVDVARGVGVAESRTTRAGAWGDFDNDGDLDLYLVNGEGPDRLLRNEGGRFTDVAAQMGVADEGDGMGAAWVDFDSDGDLDLHLVNLLGPDRLYRNDRDRFVDVAGDLGVGRGEVVNAVWGDFDGDGAPDLFEARVGTPALFRGDAGGNEALAVRVAGPGGARVMVFSGGVRQAREAQDGMVSFGLGRGAGIASVVVTWADGRQRRLISSEVSRTLRVAPVDLLPEMAVETEGIAFGEAERPVESSVTVANRGAAAMTLRTARADHAGFQVVAELPLTVLPGGSVRLPVRFAPGRPGPQAATLTLQTDDPWRGQRSLRLTATAVTPDLDVAEGLAFETTPVGKASGAEARVFNRGLRPLTVFGASAEGPFRVEVSLPFSVAPGASASVPVTFHPTRVGEAAGSFILMTDDPDRLRASVALSGRGRGTPVARLSAPDLDFGGTPTGSARSLRLTLSNGGDDDLRVTGLSASGPFYVTIEPFVLPAGEGREVEVIFKPGRPGDAAGALSLETDDPVRPTLAVPLKGRGTVPKVRVFEMDLDFGEVGLNKRVELPVVVFNEGDADLVVSQVVSEHPMFTVSAEGLTVPPGASGTLTVAYSPYWLTFVTGQIALTTNDPERRRIDLTVKGRGVPRRPAVQIVPVPSTDGGIRAAIYIDDAPALTGFAVTLRFDPALLRFESASTKGEEGLLGAGALEAPPLVREGVVTFGGARPPSAGPVREGKGLLGVVTFRMAEGLTPGGQATLRVEKVFLRGPEGSVEVGGPALTIHGRASKALRGDVDGDGRVDLTDFFALSEGFGRRSGEPGFDGRLDFNGDGRIDLEDLFILQDGMEKK